MARNIKNIVILMLASIVSCRKPYNPPATSTLNSYLVVEGVINSGADSTVITVSKTVNLLSKVTTNPVLGALLTVESDQNSSFALTESGNGNYVYAGLTLDNTRKYRLRIKTADNQQYLSDFVPLQNAPPIDSIGFAIQGSGLQLYVNTHDPNNNTRYYRWDYSETWQFHSKYYSGYITNGTEIVPRTSSQYIHYCFANDKSDVIILGSSAKLASDVIYQNPLTIVPSTSEKVELEYSILVHEYALTSDAFSFWTNLKKNTEQLGSIFDAEPSTINGNIHNVNNAAEPVIGYISAGTVQSKRIFILNSQLPLTWQPTYPYDCTLDTFYFTNPKSGQHEVAQSLIPLSSATIPVAPFSPPGSFALGGYLGSSIGCVDCTIRGTTTQPSFWK